MKANRLADYLRHIEQAATDACSFVEGLTKEAFLADKRSKSAVVMLPHRHRRGGHEDHGMKPQTATSA